MRTLSAALLLAQKQPSLDALYKIVLTLGSDEYIYDKERILSLSRSTQEFGDSATVILDNSDGVLTDLDLIGFKGVISKGLVLPDFSEEYSATAPLWVIPQLLSSQDNGVYCSLKLVGIFDLMAEDEASESYEPEEGDTDTVKDLINAIAGATLDCYSHCKAYTVEWDSEDSVIDSFQPQDYFAIIKSSSRSYQIQKLLSWTKCKARIESDEKIHIFVPTISGDTWVANTAYIVNDYAQPTTPNNNFTYRCTTAGTSHATTEPTWPTTEGGTVTDGTVVWTAVAPDYEYELAENDTGKHTFFSKSLRRRLVVPNRVYVQSHPSHATQYSGEATIEGYSSLSDDMKKTHFPAYLRLSSDAQAVSIAKAILANKIIVSEKGSGTVPMNVGAEIYDYVKITDAREGDVVLGNIGYMSETCKPSSDAAEGFMLKFGFGSLLGGFVPSTEALSGGQIDIQSILDYLNLLAENLTSLWDYLNQMLDILNYITASWSYTAIPFIIHGGGSVITTGWKGHTFMPFGGEIVAVLLAADQVGDIVVDIWKTSLADFPPDVTDTITASAKPTLDNEQGMYQTALTGWTTTFVYLDCMAFNVDSVADITQCTVYLVVKRT